MSKSRRPYLIRAIHEWACDNGHTPHLLVAADYPGVVVPQQFVQDGRITLNISPMAVQSLDLTSEPIWFSARFGGRPFDVQVPSGAVLAIFARENGEGVIFGETEASEAPADAAPPPQTDPEPPKPPKGRPNLRVVK
ncbi:ClpXP protease specificity-enhancing factor [Solimonas marina]|uniref:ClpXP protease specificity-enhancing factor n=1 Tax=Solimonas marina TaxID=2714601 RepID=A0A970B5B8_9GAMM|nr:ClpXP protease specificity-enhancing factor [Solimonas marina]NKF21380.1 ClpXP protease specificity-enhancing factor [Solimonas marina]